MNANKRLASGISIREMEVRYWFDSKKFKVEYLLVSTKPESVYSNKLSNLSPTRKLIVDLYTPIFLEKELTLSKWKPQDLLIRWRNKQMVRKFLERGNHFLVANRRQREYWLEVSRGLGVELGKNDISVFPTGASAIRKKEEGRRKKEKNIVLWFGGIYPWMNPEPLVEAFAGLAPKFTDWKLRFLGGWHPETGYKGIYRELKESSKLLIPDNQLEFVPWQAEEDLDKCFHDVAFAVHLPKQTSEDYYAHRVRLLTLLNAGIGVLTTGTDVISDFLVKLKAGIKIDQVGQMENLLTRVINEPDLRRKWSRNALNVEGAYKKQELDINNHSHILKNLRMLDDTLSRKK